jgi:hypothetical protein
MYLVNKYLEYAILQHIKQGSVLQLLRRSFVQQSAADNIPLRSILRLHGPFCASIEKQFWDLILSSTKGTMINNIRIIKSKTIKRFTINT